jgi:hypothetical protein
MDMTNNDGVARVHTGLSGRRKERSWRFVRIGMNLNR